MDKKDYLETVKKEFAKLGNIYVYGQNITVNKKSFREYTNSKSTIRTKKYHYDTYVDKMETAGMIEDVLKASVDYINEKPRHSNFPNFARGKVYLDIDNTQYSADVVVEITAGGKAVFYDLVGIKKLRNGYKYHLLTAAPHSSTAVTEVTTSDIIHQSNNEVKKNTSESSDKKPQLSIDEHGLYSRSSSSLTPRVLLSTMTDGDIESMSQAETAALTEYQDALRLCNAFDEKRAAARMRLNALKAESNQTSDVKEHIKRTQDTLKRMNAKLKETDTKLQEMEQSNFPNFARGNVYLSIGNKQ